MQPRHAFFRQTMPRARKTICLIDRTDMQMHLGRVGFPFTCQRRATTNAEAAPSARCGVELGDVALGDRESISPDGHEDRDRRAAVSAAALAMTPCHV